MAEELTNELEVEVDTCDDPGDYPNAVASGPLPSYDYINCILGEATYTLDDGEVSDWCGCSDDEEKQDFINEIVEPDLPTGIASVTKWSHKLEGCKLTIWVEGDEFEGDLEELAEEPDYEPSDYDY